MMDVDDWPRRISPVGKQFQHAQLRFGIVARAELGMKDAFLLVNEDKRCVF